MDTSNAAEALNLVDRRAFPRFKVHFLAEVYMGSEILFATVVDISEGGVGIMLPGQFYNGERINVKIKSTLYNEAEPDVQEVHICLTGQIVWIKRSEKMFRAGLKIIDIDGQDLEKLKDAIRVLATTVQDQ